MGAGEKKEIQGAGGGFGPPQAPFFPPKKVRKRKDSLFHGEPATGEGFWGHRVGPVGGGGGGGGENSAAASFKEWGKQMPGKGTLSRYTLSKAGKNGGLGET